LPQVSKNHDRSVLAAAACQHCTSIRQDRSATYMQIPYVQNTIKEMADLPSILSHIFPPYIYTLRHLYENAINPSYLYISTCCPLCKQNKGRESQMARRSLLLTHLGLHGMIMISDRHLSPDIKLRTTSRQVSNHPLSRVKKISYVGVPH
jgi:hypothetical protein